MFSSIFLEVTIISSICLGDETDFMEILLASTASSAKPLEIKPKINIGEKINILKNKLLIMTLLHSKSRLNILICSFFVIIIYLISQLRNF